MRTHIQLFEFSLSPLIQLMLQVSLYIRLYSINAIDVTRCWLNVECSNVQMFKCSNVQMFKCFNVSIFRSAYGSVSAGWGKWTKPGHFLKTDLSFTVPNGWIFFSLLNCSEEITVAEDENVPVFGFEKSMKIYWNVEAMCVLYSQKSWNQLSGMFSRMK